MFPQLIGLGVVLCALTNGSPMLSYSDLSSRGKYCSTPFGMGMCKMPNECKTISRSNFIPCASHGFICCPSFMTEHKLSLIPAQDNPTTKRTTPSTSISVPKDAAVQGSGIDVAARGGPAKGICNGRNCYEGDSCILSFSNGTCTLVHECEPLLSKLIGYGELTRCTFVNMTEVVCCPATVPQSKRKIVDYTSQINRNSFVSTTKRTTVPNPTMPPSTGNRNVYSNTTRNSCVTTARTRNCYERNSCTSASGESGICRQKVNCNPALVGLSYCSNDLVCCPLITQTPKQTGEIPQSYSPSQVNRNQAKSPSFIASTKAPLRWNTGTYYNSACSSSSGTGTCKYLSDCQPYMRSLISYADLRMCKGTHYFCCPNIVPANQDRGSATTQFKPKSLEGNSCSLTTSGSGICTVIEQCQSVLSGAVRGYDLRRCSHPPMKDIVCCPQVTPTSARPTVKPKPKPKPEFQGRPSKRACELYKAGNPKRLRTHVKGARQTSDGEFPHIGFIFGPNNDYSMYCGVALVSQRFALTTANCARLLTLTEVVRFGSVVTKPLRNTVRGFDAKVKNIWLADENIASEDYHDLALLEFFIDVPLSRQVQPACVHADTDDLSEKLDLQVNGWTTNDDFSDYMSPVLYTSTANTIGLESCNDTHYNLGITRRFSNGAHDGQYCALNVKRDECDGNIGFPLMRELDGQFEIVGILSMEFGCSSDAPSIYTRVGYYIDWVEEIVWPEWWKEYTRTLS